MVQINKDGKIDAPELVASLEKVAEATEESARLREEDNKDIEKNKKKTDAATKRAAALGKATGKLKDKIEDTAKASKGVTSTLDVFSDIIGNKAVQKLTLLAGATGILAAQTIKYGKTLVDIQRNLPNFFNQGLGQALLDTGGLMLQTGLSIENLGTVIKKNGLAFRKHGDQIGEVSDANESFRIAMGLSRDTFVSLNARSILQEQTAAKGTLTTEQLTKRTRDYIIQLDELALQTGRSISEVEDARIANSKGSAGFLATLTKEQAVLAQQGQKALEVAGGGVASLISGILSSADFTENDKKITAAELAIVQLAGDAKVSSEEEIAAQMLKLRIAQLEGDGQAIKEVFTFLGGLGKKIEDSGAALIRGRVPINEFEAQLAEAIALQSKVTNEQGQNQAEAGKAQVEGQRIQLAAIEKAIASAEGMGKLAIEINKFLSAFGGELGNVIGLLGALGFAGILLPLVAIGGPLLLFGAALTGLAIFLKDQFPEATDSILGDLFGTNAEDDRKAVQAAADKGNQEAIAIGAKNIKRIKENDKLSEQEKLDRIRNIKANVALNQKGNAEKRNLFGFVGDLFSAGNKRAMEASVAGDDFGSIIGETEAEKEEKKPPTLDSAGFPAQVVGTAAPLIIPREKFGPPRPPTVTSTAPSTANPGELATPQTAPGQNITPKVPVNISKGETDSAAKNQELQIRLADKGNLLSEEIVRLLRTSRGLEPRGRQLG